MIAAPESAPHVILHRGVHSLVGASLRAPTCRGFVCVLVAQPCPTIACQAPLSVILQARTLACIAISFSRGSSRPRDRTRKSGSLIPPALFFLLKIALAIWSLLCFHTNFNLSCSRSLKKKCHWYFDRDYIA